MAEKVARMLVEDEFFAAPDAEDEYPLDPEHPQYWSRAMYAEYDGTSCSNCGRERVERYANGRRICEKCNWDQAAEDYAYDHHAFMT